MVNLVYSHSSCSDVFKVFVLHPPEGFFTPKTHASSHMLAHTAAILYTT